MNINTAEYQEKKISVSDSVIDHPHLGVFRLDISGRPVFINQTLLRILGFQELHQFYLRYDESPEFRNNFSISRFYKYARQEDKISSLETQWLKSNLKVLFFKEFINTIYSDQGDILFFDCIIEDITNTKLVDELIKNCQARDYSILKVIPDNLFIISDDGIFLDCKSNNQYFLFENPFAFIGRSLSDVFPRDTADLLQLKIKNAIFSNSIETVEYSSPQLEKVFYYEIRIVKNSETQVLMLVRDISNQKEAEISVKSLAENLKQANASKDKFFAILAHDLRTPLIGLIGYAEILSDDIEHLSNDEVTEFSGNIVNISKQMTKLLTNLLEWSRLHTGKIKFRPSKLNMFRVVKDVFQLLQSNADHKNIHLICEVDQSLNANVDENMIFSVVNNLISNSIKFTAKNGYIRVSAKTKDNHIVISVKDNGVGMDSESLKDIFLLEKSFTTPGTENEKGSGLGIVLCKDFINKNNGEIWVESVENLGTEFFFSLPIFLED